MMDVVQIPYADTVENKREERERETFALVEEFGGGFLVVVAVYLAQEFGLAGGLL